MQLITDVYTFELWNKDVIPIPETSQVQPLFLETNSEVSIVLTKMEMLTVERKKYTNIGPCASAFVVDH
jgi:hypothetical protein